MVSVSDAAPPTAETYGATAGMGFSNCYRMYRTVKSAAAATADSSIPTTISASTGWQGDGAGEIIIPNGGIDDGTDGELGRAYLQRNRPHP